MGKIMYPKNITPNIILYPITRNISMEKPIA